MRCYIFDVDGTVANCQHRVHYVQRGEGLNDWDAFFKACDKDTPIPHILELAIKLSKTEFVIFCSGRRDSEQAVTETWLKENGVVEPIVYMRRADDKRPDNEAKADLFRDIIFDGWEPIMVFDDRDSVVKMWRDLGIPCAQVAPGNF